MDDLGRSLSQNSKEKLGFYYWKWIKNSYGANSKSKIWNKIKNSRAFKSLARTYEYGSLCCKAFALVK